MCLVPVFVTLLTWCQVSDFLSKFWASSYKPQGNCMRYRYIPNFTISARQQDTLPLISHPISLNDNCSYNRCVTPVFAPWSWLAWSEWHSLSILLDSNPYSIWGDGDESWYSPVNYLLQGSRSELQFSVLKLSTGWLRLIRSAPRIYLV